MEKKYYLHESECELLNVKKVSIDFFFYENDVVTLNIDGKIIKRKARYNKKYGVYVMIKGYAISNYDFD